MNLVPVYKQWKQQAGQPYMVDLQEFIKYHKTNNYDTKFTVDGIRYIGEVWECINMENGNKETCIIRAEYIEDEVGWAYNNPSDQPIDTWCNPIVDEYEDWQNYIKSSPGRIVPRHKNRELIYRQKEDSKKISILKQLIKNTSLSEETREAIKLRLKFMTSPDLSIARRWSKVDRSIKNQINQCIYLMCLINK